MFLKGFGVGLVALPILLGFGRVFVADLEERFLIALGTVLDGAVRCQWTWFVKKETVSELRSC